MAIALLIGPLRAPRKVCGFGEVAWICYIMITYMLFKGTSHINVRLNSITYTCFLKTSVFCLKKNTFFRKHNMSDKKICHLKNMFFKKHNMTDKKICRLKNMFFKKHNMTDKKIKICSLRNIIWRIRNIHMTDKP